MKASRCLYWALWTCAALIFVTALPGCSGCRQDPLVKRKKELDDIDKKKKKEKRKQDFELKVARTVPGDETIARPLAKPGHWVTVAHEIKANNFKFQAELHTAATDGKGQPFDVTNTPFQLTSVLPASLAKGQGRLLETTYHIPRTPSQPAQTVWLNRELRAARGGRLVTQPDRTPVTAMPGYQYYFMVLAGDPDRYGFLKRLTAVAAPTSAEFDTDTLLYYRVLLPQIDRFAPIPSRSLTWSCIAYILLDDLDSNALTKDQEDAMLDWLHWGGQIIISGPNTLEKLRGGFLDPYLPAVAGGTDEIDMGAIEPLNLHWSLVNKKTGQPRSLEVLPQKPLVGVKLLKHPQATDLANCGGLVCERRIGQGRIVVTAFPLADRVLLKWGASYDGFFNAGLLRRPRRKFEKEPTSLVANAYWADYEKVLAKDARVVTTLRYFSRDSGHFAANGKPSLEPSEIVEEEETNQPAARMRFPQSPVPDGEGSAPAEAIRPPGDDWHFLGYPFRPKTGMAAWNDLSGASDAARESLEDAAGISIPRGDFVLRILAVYLIVLAPLNWGLFRLIGRVEWAWVAAPLIAVVGAFAVVRLAQLDIGFARSVTEVAIAEVQGEYPRAHVTRYTALYTSLSTGYDFVFDDDASLSQPFGNTRYERRPHDPTYVVTLRRGRGLRLGGFRVASNSTDFVHSEQMCDLDGRFLLSGDETRGWQIDNGTRFALRDVGVIRKTLEGRTETAWLGNLDSNSAAQLEFAEADGGIPHLKQWDASLTTLSYHVQARDLRRRLDTDQDQFVDRDEAAADPDVIALFDRVDEDRDARWNQRELLRGCRRMRAGDLSLGQLVELASQGLGLGPGDARLIGWTDQELPDLSIEPAAAQSVRHTLFVVHLQRGPFPAAQPDLNSKADIVEEKERALDEDDLDEMDLLDEQSSDDAPQTGAIDTADDGM